MHRFHLASRRARIRPAGAAEDDADGLPGGSADPTQPARTVHRRTLGVALVVASSLVLGSFAFVVYGYVFSDGLCCADDSSIAVAAKNLAHGLGYGTTVPFYGGEGIELFDPLLSTGPTLVVPAAGLIAVFGNTPWAPGLATAMVATALLAGLGFVLRRHLGAPRALGFLATFALLAYALTAGPTFVHWYSLLGEVPAALFTVLGLALVAWRADRRGPLVWGFVALGLAALTKTVAVLGVLPAVVLLVVRLVADRENRRARWIDLGVAAAAGVAPLALFELVKLGTLGLAGYRRNLRDFLDFLLGTGSSVGESSFAGQVAANIGAFRAAFGFGAPVAVVVTLAIAWLLVRRTEGSTRTFAVLLLGGATVHLLWYATSSEGNPRYALIGLLLAAAAAAGLVAVTDVRIAATAVAVTLLLVAIPAWARLAGPVQYAVADGYRPNQRVQDLAEAAAFLAAQPRDDALVGSWWATVVDLEYMLPTSGNFAQAEHLPTGERPDGQLLARNEVFVQFALSPAFEEWSQECDDVLFQAGRYLVTRCPADPEGTGG